MRWIILLGAFGLAGCGGPSPAVADCIEHVKSRLKSPSSFVLFETSTVLMEDNDPHEVWVEIKYDAENSYGAKLRKSHTCHYPASQGEPTIAGRLPDTDDEVSDETTRY